MNNTFRERDGDGKRAAIPPPVPVFRSVSMMAPPPLPMQRSLVSSHHLKGSGSAGSVPTQMKPLEKLSVKTPNSSWSSLDTDRNQFTWQLSKISSVPLYHPLERTAIHCIEPLSIILQRLCSFMKTHSVHCTYQDEQARIKCATDCALRFAVQLWKQNETTTIIEVQRQEGCAIRMQALRQDIKEVLLYGETKGQGQTESDSAQYGASQRACQFLQQVPVDSQEALGHCLEMSSTFLQSDFLDQNRLGLESLVVLTDASKVIAKDAEETSRKVLQDSTLQESLAKFLSADADSKGYDEQLHGTMHLLTLKVLSHALDTVQQSNKTFFLDLNSSSFWQTALEAMYKDIQFANERPIEAALSIRAMNLLRTMEPSAFADVMKRPHLSMFLQVAHEFGKQHNQSLQRESELLLRNHVY